MKITLNLLFILALFLSCNDATKNKTIIEPEIHKGVVQDILNVSEYSYILVLEDGKEKWLAAPITNVEKGGKYYYSKTMEMKNFESKELNKSFETIYFIEKISATEDEVTLPSTADPHTLPMVPNKELTTAVAAKPVIDKKDLSIAATENTISIAELFKNRETYNNKVVRLRGEVTKYNPAIMDVNWLHLQDGTEYNTEFDLTVTTTTTVQVGDVVTLEGKVTLNKDFGAGYTYDIIIENAAILN